MKKKLHWYSVIVTILFICAFSVLFLGCHHHDPQPPIPPVVDNPASYIYTAKVVDVHQPGFFSCANMDGRILFGTYQDYHHKMHCQLCELVNGKIKVLSTFEGESVYHIRPYKGYCVLPIEQGNLYSWNGTPTKIKNRTYRMGFYDFLWLDGHSYAIEKKNVYPPSVVAIYRDLKPWFFSTGWKAKDLQALGGKLYASATPLNNHTEAAIVEIDPVTKAVKFFKMFRWCWTGGLGIYDGAVWTSFDCDGTFYNTKGEEFHLGDHGWFIGAVGDTLFATTGGKWRGVGPSHLWVFNPETRKFEKKLDIQDAEPWFMCAGPAGNQYYLVTRNEKEGNLGRVYLITRRK